MIKSKDSINYVKIKLILSLFFCILQGAISPLFPGEEQTVDIHGFISQGYLKSDHNNIYADTEEGSFQFNEMGINFSTSITENLNIGMQFFAMDLGSYGNDEVILDWGFADYKWRDYLGLRAGKIKLPHGLYNEYMDVDSVTPMIFYPVGIYNKSWRDVTSSSTGVGLYGAISSGWLGKIKYQLLIGSTNVAAGSSIMTIFEDIVNQVLNVSNSNVTDIQVSTAYVYSLFLRDMFSVNGLRVGVSGWQLEMDIGFEIQSFMISTLLKTRSINYSVEYVNGKFTLAGECKLISYDTELEPEYTDLAFYGLLSYQFTDWFEGSICYSEKYGTKDDINGHYHKAKTGQAFRAWIKDSTISTRIDINPNWAVKLEVHYFDGVSMLVGQDNGPPVELVNGVPKYPYERYWFLYAAKISYSF